MTTPRAAKSRVLSMPGEGLGGVGRVSGRPGDVDLEAVRRVRRLGPHVLGERGDRLPPVGPAVQRDDHLRRLAVLRRDRPDDLAVEPLALGERLHVLLDGGEIGRREAVGPLVDDDGGDDVRVGPERDLLLQRERGLGVTGQPGRDLVVLLVEEAGRQGSGGRCHNEPEDEDDPLQAW